MNAGFLNERLATWIAHETTTHILVAKLEAELRSVHEAMASLEIENHSLQVTFDLIGNEKSLLLRRLAESDRVIEVARSRNELVTMALTAAQIERRKLIAEIATGNAKLELIRSTLLAKERQIRELEQSGSGPSEILLADTVTF